MSKYQAFMNQVIDAWRLYGRCGVYIFRPISPIFIVANIVKRYLDNNENNKVLIIVKNITDRDDYYNSINSFCNTLNTDKVLIITKATYKKLNHLNYGLVISINIEDYDILYRIVYSDEYKFYLTIFDKRDFSDKGLIGRESIIKPIIPSFPINEIIEENIYSPVKETLIGVDLSDENRIEYDKCNEYIKDSMKIFGSFEVLNKCRAGDNIMNYSPIRVCTNVANNNGWNEQLDTSTPFGKEIDNIYNPAALNERANISYQIMKKRKDLVTDNHEKFINIHNLCKDFSAYNILIVSARGEFTYDLAKYLTDNGIECGQYHNDLPNTIELDDNGNPKIYRSGNKKGEPKIISHQRQSTIAMNKYNNGDFNIMCIKASSSNKLSIDVNIVIITSPIIGTIYDIRRRFSNIMFKSNPLIVYTLYCKNTIEHNIVDKYEESWTHEVIRDDENIFISM